MAGQKPTLQGLRLARAYFLLREKRACLPTTLATAGGHLVVATCRGCDAPGLGVASFDALAGWWSRVVGAAALDREASAFLRTTCCLLLTPDTTVEVHDLDLFDAELAELAWRRGLAPQLAE